MRVLEKVDSLRVLKVADHRMVSEPEACMLAWSYKMAWEAYTKVWVQLVPEMVEHRRASDQVEHRKASLVEPCLMEQHRLVSYPGVEAAYSWEHWHYMVGIPEEALPYDEAGLAGCAVEGKAF